MVFYSQESYSFALFPSVCSISLLERDKIPFSFLSLIGVCHSLPTLPEWSWNVHPFSWKNCRKTQTQDRPQMCHVSKAAICFGMMEMNIVKMFILRTHTQNILSLKENNQVLQEISEGSPLYDRSPILKLKFESTRRNVLKILSSCGIFQCIYIV